jgi:PLP dependent protein
MSNSQDRLLAIQNRVTAAGAGVTLIAVSKTFGIDEICPVLEAGQRVFGENRVQEAAAKWPALRSDYLGIELHLIGPLQSNKAAEAVALFDVIQTVDRPKIAAALSAECLKQARSVDFYVQINTGAEPQKAGVLAQDADQFIEYCRSTVGLNLIGLMCIPPVGDDPRPHFRMLREIAHRNTLHKLSMGMSADFEIAIAEGATAVRVGSAIFGSR